MKARPFTDDEIAVIRQLYPDHRTEDIAKQLNRSINSIYGKAHSLSLKKSHEFKQSPQCGILIKGHKKGAQTQFKKGHIPVNKGKKGEDYMSKESLKKMRNTFFQKNHIPHNALPVGSESVNVYLYIKLPGERKVKIKHRWVWEQANGPIPKGYNVQFKDGNRLNCHIDNLYLISRADQLAKENGFYVRYPEEIRKLISLKAQMQRTINRKKNE
jgi:hypothetical protein